MKKTYLDTGKASEAFFDMHLHILPGLDDGSRSMDETCRMVEMEMEQGVSYMCATPHFRLESPLDREKVIETYKEICDVLSRRFPKMRLYLGQELFYSAGIVKALKEKRAFTLNGSRYVLLEFVPDETYPAIFTALKTLVENGYIPVMAHVERVNALWKQRERLDELRSMCIPFQMNTSSLIGSGLNPSVRYCRRLVSEGYIDLFGTDAHGAAWRPPDYRQAAEWVFSQCGEEILKRLTMENPSRILQNQLLEF